MLYGFGGGGATKMRGGGAGDGRAEDVTFAMEVTRIEKMKKKKKKI